MHRQDGAHAAIPDTGSMRCRRSRGPELAVRAERAVQRRSRPRCRGSPTRTPGTSAASRAAPPTWCPAGRAQARPAHDPRGEPGRGRGGDPPRDRRGCAAAGCPASRWRSGACAGALRCSRCPGNRRSSRRCSATARGLQRRSRPRARRCTPTCACTASAASLAAIYGAGPRTVFGVQRQRVPTSTSLLEDLQCATRSPPARCSTCCSEPGRRAGTRSRPPRSESGRCASGPRSAHENC